MHCLTHSTNLQKTNGVRKQEQLVAEVEMKTVARLKLQSAQLDKPMVFQGWLVKPTLSPQERTIYFATHSLWHHQQIIHLQIQSADAAHMMLLSIETPMVVEKVKPQQVKNLLQQVVLYLYTMHALRLHHHAFQNV